MDDPKKPPKHTDKTPPKQSDKPRGGKDTPMGAAVPKPNSKNNVYPGE